jgi:hypothetical protein
MAINPSMKTKILNTFGKYGGSLIDIISEISEHKMSAPQAIGDFMNIMTEASNPYLISSKTEQIGPQSTFNIEPAIDQIYNSVISKQKKPLHKAIGALSEQVATIITQIITTSSFSLMG